MRHRTARATRRKAQGRAHGAGDGRVQSQSQDNVAGQRQPKRKGSKEAKRYALYRNGMTLAQAFEAGMNTLNLTHDIERKCNTGGRLTWWRAARATCCGSPRQS
jgi:hypothetical protein